MFLYRIPALNIYILEVNLPPALTIIKCEFCIYRFRMILSVNSDYLFKQR
jgi:hypothetical protein